MPIGRGPYGEIPHPVDNNDRRYIGCPETGGGITEAQVKANDAEHKISISSCDRGRKMEHFLLRKYHGCVTGLGRWFARAERYRIRTLSFSMSS